ncbi:MAG: hypothetical protein H6636_07035 [Anaerolineales bacterium]|nr:hypothetical protein [Anaerolineales bacterium]
MTRPFDPREYAAIAQVRAELQPGAGQRLWRQFLTLETSLEPYVDISKYQPAAQINYAAARAGGLLTAWLRTSDGGYTDTEFPLHLMHALEAGWPVAAYHFFRSNQDPHTQANLVWSILQPALDALGFCPLVWGDCETTDGVANADRLNKLEDFFGDLALKIKNATGQVERCGLYSSPGFANTALMPTPPWLKNTTPGQRIWQWLAHYTSASLPTQPTGWPVANRLGWQRGVSDPARTHPWVPYPLPGFGTMAVDYDLTLIEKAVFLALVGAVPAPPTPATGLAMRVTAAALNVRMGPGTNYPIVYQLHAGDEVVLADVGGSSAWGNLLDGNWGCVQLNTTRFMEAENHG